MSAIKLLCVAGLMMGAAGALGGCCGSSPDDIWNGVDYPDDDGTTWRCADSPIGNACFVFFREGNAIITQAGAGGSDVLNWEKTCGGMTLYGNYDEATVTDFDGGKSDGTLSFYFNWSAVDLAGDTSCVLEDVDPTGHVCP